MVQAGVDQLQGHTGQPSMVDSSVAAPASGAERVADSSTVCPASGVKGRASPAPSWSSSAGSRSTCQLRSANHAALTSVSGWRSGWRRWLGTNRPAPVVPVLGSTRALTTPALAVNTRSGTSGWGSICSTVAPAARNAATSPAHSVSARSGSTVTSRRIHGLISYSTPKCRGGHMMPSQGSGATLIDAPFGMRNERSALRAEHRTVLIVRSLRSLTWAPRGGRRVGGRRADVGDDAQCLVAAAVSQRVTTAWLMSTQNVSTPAGRQLPVAMACRVEASMSATCTPSVSPHAVGGDDGVGDDVGQGPVVAYRPAEHERHARCTQARITPPAQAGVDRGAIRPCRRTSLMARRWLAWPPSVGCPPRPTRRATCPGTFASMS